MFPKNLRIRAYDPAAAAASKQWGTGDSISFKPVDEAFADAPEPFAAGWSPRAAQEPEGQWRDCAECGRQRLEGWSARGQWYCTNCWEKWDTAKSRQPGPVRSPANVPAAAKSTSPVFATRKEVDEAKTARTAWEAKERSAEIDSVPTPARARGVRNGSTLAQILQSLHAMVPLASEPQRSLHPSAAQLVWDDQLWGTTPKSMPPSGTMTKKGGSSFGKGGGAGACGKGKGASSECFKCGELGHFASNCPNLADPSGKGGGGGGSFGKGGGASATCFKCGGFGHLANNCPNSGEQGERFQPY